MLESMVVARCRLVLAAALLCGGCSDETESTGPYTPTPLPPLVAAPLTTERGIAPVHERLADPDVRNPSVPGDLSSLLADGFGEITETAGEEHLTLTPDGAEPPAPGPGARMLVRFAHLADFQLADDESPTRLAAFDAPAVTGGAFRPQESHQCRVVNAIVRTVNAVHREGSTPLDFVLLGGDNADSAQTNEVGWVLGLLDGSERLECDSGADDDLAAGGDNDPKDPFVAEGLDVPWFWVTGNHDVLKQGNVPISEGVVLESLGSFASGGARSWAEPGGPVVIGDVVADERRRALSPAELVAMVAADGDGHGLHEVESSAGKANYTFDVPGTPLRFVVLDFAAQTGGSSGLLRRNELEDFVVPALEEARAEDKWVIFASHHQIGALGDGTGFGGTQQPDAVLPAEYIPLLGSYPNVLFSVAAHSHVHDVHLFAADPAAETSHAFWELVTSAASDFPQQARIVEIWDQDNGWVMLRATTLDYATDGDPVAAEGRRLAVTDFTSAWTKDGRGTAEDRNVELWLPAPP
jgi:hypothetical protein